MTRANVHAPTPVSLPRAGQLTAAGELSLWRVESCDPDTGYMLVRQVDPLTRTILEVSGTGRKLLHFEDATGAFSITSGPATPYIIPGWGSEDVEVTFTPPGLGAHEAFLHIRSDAPDQDTYVNLYGVGVRGWRCIRAQAAPSP